MKMVRERERERVVRLGSEGVSYGSGVMRVGMVKKR